MRRRKKQSGNGGGDSWLNTYADMVTLLLTFFVMLFTMSSIDADKWRILVEAFASEEVDASQVVLVPVEIDDGFIGDTDDESNGRLPENIEELDFNMLYYYMKQYVDEQGLESTVTLEKGENSVFIRFQDSVFFDPDKAELKKDALPLLEFLGACFLAVEDEILSIRINGHTATVPGTVKKPGFDRTLSTERANSVLLYFEEETGFDPKRLVAIGYGRNYPLATNDSEEGRRRNRRVEIMILSNDFDISEESDLFLYMSGQIDVDLFEDEQNREDILIPDSSDSESEANNTSPISDTSNQAGEENRTADGRTIYREISPYEDTLLGDKGE